MAVKDALIMWQPPWNRTARHLFLLWWQLPYSHTFQSQICAMSWVNLLCICEKDQDQVHGSCAADQPFLVATYVVHSLYYFWNFKFLAIFCCCTAWFVSDRVKKTLLTTYHIRGVATGTIQVGIWSSSHVPSCILCPYFLYKSYTNINSLVLTNMFLWLYHYHMSRDVRKPVFGVSNQVRHKPGWAITEDG